MAERATQIELARIVSLFAVVTLHVVVGIPEQGWPGFLVNELSRFAVPVFFLISGYFLAPRYFDAPLRSLAGLFVKLIVPFAFWAIVYVLLENSQLLYPRQQALGPMQYLLIPLTGGPGHHLWFLPALFIGTAIVVPLLKYAGLRATLAVCGVLYAIGLLAGSYLSINGIAISPAIYRNGVFFAPLFLAIGFFLSGHRLPVGWAWLCLVLGAGLQLAEGVLIGTFPSGHDMALGTIPYAVGVFSLFAAMHIRSPQLNALGRDVLGAYLVHLILVRLFETHLAFGGVPGFLVSVICVFVLSLGFSRLMKASAVTARLV